MCCDCGRKMLNLSRFKLFPEKAPEGERLAGWFAFASHGVGGIIFQKLK